MYESSSIDQSQFNMGIAITMRLDLWLRRADEYYVMRMPEQQKLCYDNIYRIVAIYLKDMDDNFRNEMKKIRLFIDKDIITLNVLRNRVLEGKQTRDKNYYEQMVDILLKELAEYDMLLTELRQTKGLNLPDKPNPGKSMLNIGGK